MELNLSLRSLEAAGRPSGTGRPSLPSTSRDEHGVRSDRADENDSRARAEAGEREDVRARERRTSDETDGSRRHAHEAGEERKSGVRARRSDGARRTRDAGEDERGAEPANADEGRADFETVLRSSPRATKAGVKPGVDSTASTRSEAEPTASPTNADGAAQTREGEASQATTKAKRDPFSALLANDALAAALVAEPESVVDLDTELVLESDASAPLELVEGETEPAGGDTSPAELALAPNDAPLDAAKSATTLPSEAEVARAHTTPSNTPTAESASSAATKPPPAPRGPREDARAADVLRQVRVHLTPKLDEAVIQLHPAELGRISIRLNVEDDGLVARVRAEKREALDALERHLPELRAALARQGIEAQHFDLALGFRDERPASDGRTPRAARGRGTTSDEPASTSVELGPRLRGLAASGGIDTYA